MITNNSNATRKVCLLGVAFDTGNMGVSALGASILKGVLDVCPSAEITVLGHGPDDERVEVRLGSGTRQLDVLNTSFSKRIWQRNHYLRQLILAVCYRIFPVKRLRGRIIDRSRCLRTICQSDACLDICGGDSFSDIYGLGRLLYISSYKILTLLLKKKLVLMPQTVGLFNGRIARFIARFILKGATVVYSRDRAGVKYVEELLGDNNAAAKVHFAPDVAFILDSCPPARVDVGLLQSARTSDSIVVGMNVNGLVFNGGYNRNNMFRLKADYQRTILRIMEELMADKRVLVVLVPHVFGPIGNIESDSDACLQIYDSLRAQYPGRLFLARGDYDQSEVKHIIGMCDFFIGTRMHSCIAALSQGIPAVGVAYSKKFSGVFASARVGDYVVDLRQVDEEQAAAAVTKAFQERQRARDHLKNAIPQMQKQVLKIFEESFQDTLGA